jgi:hypothetical protein
MVGVRCARAHTVCGTYTLAGTASDEGSPPESNGPTEAGPLGGLGRFAPSMEITTTPVRFHRQAPRCAESGRVLRGAAWRYRR